MKSNITVSIVILGSRGLLSKIHMEKAMEHLKTTYPEITDVFCGIKQPPEIDHSNDTTLKMFSDYSKPPRITQYGCFNNVELVEEPEILSKEDLKMSEMDAVISNTLWSHAQDAVSILSESINTKSEKHVVVCVNRFVGAALLYMWPHLEIENERFPKAGDVFTLIQPKNSVCMAEIFRARQQAMA